MMCVLGLSIVQGKQGYGIAADGAQAAIEGDEVGLMHVRRSHSVCT